MRFNTKTIAENAVIACTYVVLILTIAPLAYSEIMVFLAFYNKRWIPGLIIGCFIANIPSPLGIYDIFFVTLSTIIVCFCVNKTTNRYLATVIGAVVTGSIIGYELHLAFGIPFFINATYVAVGEFVVLMIGAICFKYIEKNKRFMQLMKEG